VSKRRLVITAVLSGSSQSEVARKYRVSQGWISRLMAQYRAEGQAVFQPASRAPKSRPNATNPQTVELILRLRKELIGQGHDAGADTLRWHLRQHHHLTVSRATIHRILVRAAAVTPAPQKRPRSSWIRFEAEQPNETWQSDFTHYRLTHPDGRPGADVEVITWLDDHSRMALHISAHRRITAHVVHATFVETAATYGNPASTLTDIQSGWATYPSLRVDGRAGSVSSGTRPSSLFDRLERSATSCLLTTLAGGATAGGRAPC
jgi:transposase